MPRSGGGLYTLPAGSIVTDGVDDILASQHNTPLQDIASDLNAARPISSGGTGATTAPGARTALGLAIGTNVQAYDAALQSISALGTAANKMLYTTGVDTFAEADITAAGRAILDDVDAAAQLVTLGAQPSDATLTSLAGLSLVAGDLLYATGADTVARLAKGADGTALTIASGVPAYVAPTTPFQTITPTATATIETNTFNPNKSYMIQFVGVRSNTSGADMTLAIFGDTDAAYSTASTILDYGGTNYGYGAVLYQAPSVSRKLHTLNGTFFGSATAPTSNVVNAGAAASVFFIANWGTAQTVSKIRFGWTVGAVFATDGQIIIWELAV